MIWIQLSHRDALRAPLIVRVDPNLVQVKEQARWKANAPTLPDRETIPEQSRRRSFNCWKMSGKSAEIKAQCEPTEPTEGPTDFPRMRRL